MVSYNYAPKTIGRAVSLTQWRRNLKRNCFCGAFQPVLRRYVLSIVPRYYVIVEGAAGNLDRWCLQSCERSKILCSKRLQNVANYTILTRTCELRQSPPRPPLSNRTRKRYTSAAKSGESKHFERRNGRQCFSPVAIYRKCTQRTICPLYGKRQRKKIMSQ